MESLKAICDLIVKLSSPLKGLSRFFYVWAHYSEISRLLDYYREQIKDREQFLEYYKKITKETTDLEKKKIMLEAEDRVRKAYDEGDQRAKKIANLWFEELVVASTIIALYFRESPLFESVLREQLKPGLKQLVDLAAKELASFPPPPTFQFNLLGDLFERKD